MLNEEFVVIDMLPEESLVREELCLHEDELYELLSSQRESGSNDTEQNELISYNMREIMESICELKRILVDLN